MSASEEILNKIQSFTKGEPFKASHFAGLAERYVIDQTLYRLAKSGKIKRVTRGVYAVPKVSELFGEIPVSPSRVAHVIAESRGEKIQVLGAEAANRLGLSLQVPVREILLTSGQSRVIRTSGGEIRLRHAGKRSMVGAGTPAGVVVSALNYLGREESSQEKVIDTLRHRLSEEEKQSLKAVIGQVPAWMARIFGKVLE